MQITRLDTHTVSVPYRHRENSARVRRDGVTAVLVRLETDDGLVGWGECCPGPNVESIAAIVRSAVAFALIHIVNIQTDDAATGLGQAILTVVIILPVGLVFGWIFVRVGLLGAIAAHAFYNGLLLFLATLAATLPQPT